jgi:hypothetical protein
MTQGPPPPPPFPYQGPMYPPQPPKQKRSAVWIVLAVLGGVSILFCGGCLAFAGVFLNEVDKSVSEEEKHDTPTTVEVGAPFEHDDFKVAGGWSLVERYGTFHIKGLRVTNDGDDQRNALLTFRIYRNDDVLDEVECSANQMQHGESSKMDCFSFGDDTFTKDYDQVRVSDAW